MKMNLVCSGVTVFLLAALTPRAGAEILAGPITNPANGHDYYLLTPNTWSASEAEAENLGGTLAVIQNDAEQEWVFSRFGSYGGTNRSLWIGLHRNGPGGPFVSVTDARVNYFNWAAGEPNNGGGGPSSGKEIYVHMEKTGNGFGNPPGFWNDLESPNINYPQFDPLCGVVEVPGKANEPALTAHEKSLIGDWYNNGDPDHRCHIVGTANQLFAINENREASRIIDTPEGYLFSPTWKQHVTVQGDKLLWSWGNWWSREPAKFKMPPTAADAQNDSPKAADVPK